MSTHSYRKPKTLTRKVRNLLKRAFDNKGYWDEKQIQSIKRGTEREKHLKSKIKMDKMVDALIEESILSMIKDLPRAPTHDPATLRNLQTRLDSLKKGGTRKKRKSTLRKSRAKQ